MRKVCLSFHQYQTSNTLSTVHPAPSPRNYGPIYALEWSGGLLAMVVYALNTLMLYFNQTLKM